MESWNVWPFAPGFFQLAWCIQVSSVLLHGSILHSSFWPNNIPLCEHTVFCLSICQLMDIWVVSIFALIWIMQLWAFVVWMYFQFSPKCVVMAGKDECPGVGETDRIWGGAKFQVHTRRNQWRSRIQSPKLLTSQPGHCPFPTVAILVRNLCEHLKNISSQVFEGVLRVSCHIWTTHNWWGLVSNWVE